MKITEVNILWDTVNRGFVYFQHKQSVLYN